jgi:hypothetical protein
MHRRGWLATDAPRDRGRAVDLVRCRESSTIEEPGMATKATVALEDDLDGGPAHETVRFGVGGTAYEIDLTRRTPARSTSNRHPLSSMPAGRGGGSAARARRQAGSAVATSGRGPTNRASRSAATGASRPALWSRPKPRPGILTDLGDPGGARVCDTANRNVATLAFTAEASRTFTVNLKRGLTSRLSKV